MDYIHQLVMHCTYILSSNDSLGKSDVEGFRTTVICHVKDSWIEFVWKHLPKTVLAWYETVKCYRDTDELVRNPSLTKVNLYVVLSVYTVNICNNENVHICGRLKECLCMQDTIVFL